MQAEQLTDKLRQSLTAIKKLRKEVDELKTFHGPIAVVSVACRFPGDVHSPQDYWKLLLDKTDAITDIPADRWDIEALYDANPETPGKMYARQGGFLEGIEEFDASFFGISPNEAEAIDPQQRLLLQTTWEAFEQAGIAPETIRGSQTGVFIGIAPGDYMQHRATTTAYHLLEPYDVTGNISSTAAGRIAYTFDFHGPNLALDTACSSSLVAVHLACRSLLDGECTMAVAGGVNLILQPNAHIIFSRMKAISPNGRCKTFDAEADGFVRSEGCGVVVLKRLKDAVRDGDQVLALIRGSAINQDGHSNGLTAPNGLAQQAVIRQALQNASLTTQDVCYVETHGTGTSLGDPIEIEAISNVFREGRLLEDTLYVGSAKTNLGHLESAAGMAALLKTVLALKHRTIPAHLHFKNPSPHIKWREFIKVPVEAVPYQHPTRAFTAGVSAFGFSGTNAHLVLQEYLPPAEAILAPPTAAPYASHLLALSAKTAKGLGALAQRYAELLADQPEISFVDLCYTAAVGRSHFAHRAALVAKDRDEALSQLRQLADGRPGPRWVLGTLKPTSQLTMACLFTGQGAQYQGMGAELFQHEPVFRQALEKCAGILAQYIDQPLLELLYPAGGPVTDLAATQYAQPCLFALEYALYELWHHWGLKPQWLVGHSLGEYVAACVAGVFSLEDGLKLVATRGRLMQALPAGGVMTAVMTNASVVQQTIQAYPLIALAAFNGPESVVLSGDVQQMAAVVDILQEQGIKTLALNVSHAFHSPLMKPMLAEFERVARTVTYHRPRLPLLSNVTGALASDELATADYWVQHVLAPVHFAQAIAQLQREACTVFLEIGPKPILTGLAKRIITAGGGAFVASLREGQSSLDALSQAAAMLYAHGANLQWPKLYAQRPGQRTELPTYPFQRQRHWLSPIPPPAQRAAYVGHPLLGERQQLATPTNTYVWTQTFNLVSLPYLADHRIEGAIVFPAACYTEMALSSVCTLTGTLPLRLSAIQFAKAFVLQADGQYEVQTLVSKQAEGSYHYEIYSRESLPGQQTAWVPRMSGQATVLEAEAALTTPLDLAAIQSRCKQKIAGADFYAQWFAAGNNWGDMFRGIEHLWVGQQEALAQEVAPSAIAPFLTQYVGHPALLDICGQVLAASVPSNGGAFVGKAIEEIRVYRPLRSEHYWSHATLRKGDGQSRSIIGDVRVLDAAGNTVAETRGVEFEFIAQTGAIDLRDASQWLYDVQWRAEVVPSPSPDASSKWLLLDPDQTLAPSLMSALRTLGSMVLEVEDAGALVSALTQEVSAVVYLLPLLNQQAEVAGEVTQLAAQLAHVAALVQSLKANASPAKLWLVTADAWGGSARLPYGAAFWGLARTLAAEYPSWWGGIVDYSDQLDTKQLADKLAAVLSNSPTEQEFRLTREAIEVPRLVRSRPLSIALAPTFRKDGTYLITGGLGALGLLVAKWMVQQGARRLLLLSRTALPVRANWHSLEATSQQGQRIQAVRELEEAGAFVETIAVDIADEATFSQWLRSYRAEQWPTIRGVVHAAGIVEYRLGESLEVASVTRQLAAKVTGAALLDRYLSSDLDFFVLFSSASALLNSPGLGVYAAANAFLDALALRRRTRQLPALSINWGAWAEVGMAATQGGSGVLQALETIPPAQGIATLEKLWATKQGQIAVLPVDWLAWQAKHAAVVKAPLLRELMSASVAASQSEARSVLPDLHTLALPELLPFLEEYVAKEASLVLRLERAELDWEVSLSYYGLDSMMAIEMKNRLEGQLRLTLTMVDLIQGPSIRELAAKLAAKVMLSEAAPELHPTHYELAPGTAFPLSQGQRSLWALYAMDPTNAAYNVAFSARITSALNPEAVHQAFTRLVQRHAPLRAQFIEVEGEVQQFTRPADELALHFEIVVAAGWNEVQLKEQVYQASQRPFRLEDGPLIRAQLFDCGSQGYVLLLTIHHIACDGWSLWVLLDEFKEQYAALMKGDTLLDSELQFTYYDYIRWQEALLAGPEGERLWHFWQTQLHGKLPVLHLPTDYPRGNAKPQGATHAFQVDAALTMRLKQFSQQEGSTLYVTALAAFQLLLHRYSGQDDILVGSPTAGRSNAAFVPVVGDFINLTVIRTKLVPMMSFRTLLAQVRRTVMGALAHQDYPFPLLVKNLQPERQAGQSPIVQAIFSLQKPQQFQEIIRLLSGEEVSWGLLSLAPYAVPQQEGQFDLTLEVVEGKENLAGVLKYNASLFSVAFIEQFQRQWVDLLDDLVRRPDQPVTAFALISPQQQAQLIAPQQHESVPFPAQGIHQLIEEQVVRTPTAVALVYEDEVVTYAELNARANRLARYLRQHGVGRETLVGICTARSVDMLVSLLAVLKAGGAYVPLDPHFPSDRLTYIIADSGIQYMLTDGSCEPLVRGFVGVVLNLHQEASLLAQVSAAPLDAIGSPDDLAYIIYTSGSTGKPKGTMLEHRQVVNFCTGMNQALGREAGTLLAVTTISFDISVLELFWTLTNGFKVVLQSDDISHLTDSVPAFVEKQSADFSLFYFASVDQEASSQADKYQLLLEGARYADAHGYKAIWTPERHFHSFGGLYPNPSVTSAALAAATTRLAIRAGSVVAPLHHPLRIAEEWSVVDNLSRGRVGISFASGWQVNDFVLAQDAYEDRQLRFFDTIEAVRQLWRGEAVPFTNGEGDIVSTQIFPRPIQSELPVWITAAGNPETFRAAGAHGAHLLTHLLTQTVEELAEHIAIYRQARQDHGHDPAQGIVTLMLHTYIGDDLAEVKERVRGPFTEYLRSSLDLMRNMAKGHGLDIDDPSFATKGIEVLLPKAFERYFHTASLMGTVESAECMVDRVLQVGVTEIACLLDFGLATTDVLASLAELTRLKDKYCPAAPVPQRHYTIAEQLTRHQVTHLQCTPSLARMLLLDQASRQALGSLQKWLLGGECLPLALVQEIQTLTPATIHNMYGPTETTVWSTTRRIDQADEKVYLGPPIANTQLYVLDEFLNPVPPGLVGELYVGGSGVARGYLGKPELTAQRFIQHPFRAEPGARLYRTGDLVKYTLAGELEYIERADNQVKINGHRIEPEEIEAVLNMHPAVQTGAVVAVKTASDDAKLVAHIVLQDSMPVPPASELRQHLKAHLPTYMVPTLWVFTTQLPLTPNGKLDRQALRASGVQQPISKSHFAAPRTLEEDALAGIWQQVLHLKQVSIHDNFFELGGDSILSIQLVSKAKSLGIHFTINQLFQHQTIAELAPAVQTIQALVVEQGSVTGTIPLTPIQHWFFCLGLQAPHHYNQSMMLELPSDTHVEALPEIFAHLVEHHDMLRARYRQQNEEWRQELPATEPHELVSFIDLSATEPANFYQALEADAATTQASLHLENGPLFRVRVYMFGGGRSYRLLMVGHHLVIDGISWRILLEDLALLLTQQAQGTTAQLPAKTTSFKEWATQLTAYAQSGPLRQQQDYWLRLAAGGGWQLPIDGSAPTLPNTVASASHFVVRLSQALTHSLLHDIFRVQNVQINDLLLTALFLTLSEWMGQDEVCIDLEGHGREPLTDQLDVSRTVGWFTSMMPLRLAATTREPAQVLKAIKEQVRQLPQHGIGYGILRYLAGGESHEQLVTLPKAQVLFNYLGQFDASLSGWRRATEETGPLYGLDNMRSHLLEIVGGVLNGQLELTWYYSLHQHQPATISRLAERYLTFLEQLILQCQSNATDTFTPSDFPGLKMNQQSLDALLVKLQ